MLRYLILVLIFAISAVPIFAQDADVETIEIYYENDNPHHLDHVLVQLNICLERFLQLNPELDITYIEYGEKIVIPVNEPCYDGKHQSASDVIPRLKYYENGRWLDNPYYSSDVRYIYPRNYDITDLAKMVDVCVDDLLSENILLQDFETYSQFITYTTMDIFVPQSNLDCVLPTQPQSEQEKLIVLYNTELVYIPSYFGKQFNICAEEVYPSITQYELNTTSSISIRAKINMLPCYNDSGKRLSYYDEHGNKRDNPVYSDLPVYIAKQDETMQSIAEQFDVCLVDLLRHNGFLDLTVYRSTEVFIPSKRACPDLRVIPLSERSFEEAAKQTNICPDVLHDLNPQLSNLLYNSLNTQLYISGGTNNRLVILPADDTPCYYEYHPEIDESLYDIEDTYNICHEEFVYYFGQRIRRHIIVDPAVTVFIPIDSQPCYNENGQRLYYPSQYPDEPSYHTDMQVYELQHGDNAYRISQQFNVCVHDLLSTNPALVSSMYTGLRIFIPDTRPCYDPETGLQLIYEDEDGHHLDTPQLSDQLIHYGNQPRGYISYYYNVCQNRIEDANRAKLNKEAAYLGWIIPTDRPPCYDAEGDAIDYVCYTQPIDMTADYRNSNYDVSFDYDGTNCYDLSKPETIVWYHNKPYQLIFYQDTLLQSRAFTAWCYGVSLDDIDYINEQEDVLAILPFQARLIPQPTRDCYLDHPDILQSKTIRVVLFNETVASIASEYDVPYQLIALANDLDEDSTIWYGQRLIIPDSFTWNSLIAYAGSILAIVVSIILLYRRKQRSYHKNKGLPKKR